MPKVSTNLTVSTENDRDLQIATAMFGDVIGILAGNNLSYNLGSYEVVDEDEIDESDAAALADWEQQLLDDGHKLEGPCPCIKQMNSQLKEETHEPGFPHIRLTGNEGPVITAKCLVADMVNDQTGLSYSDSSFELVAANPIGDDGWVVILGCKDRPEYRYEVTRVTSKDETTIEQYKYDRAITVVGS